MLVNILIAAAMVVHPIKAPEPQPTSPSSSQQAMTTIEICTVVQTGGPTGDLRYGTDSLPCADALATDNGIIVRGIDGSETHLTSQSFTYEWTGKTMLYHITAELPSGAQAVTHPK